MESPLHSFLASELACRRVILADLDGCLISGGAALPGAAALAAQCGARLWIVSNNSSDTGATLSARLADMGIAVPPSRILLAGERLLRQIALRMPGVRLRLLAEPPLQRLADDLGLRRDGQPELAVLGRWTGFDFAALDELCALVARGVPVIAANPDTSHPGIDGAPRPETGALLAALAAAVGPAGPAGGRMEGRLPPWPAEIMPVAKPAPTMLHAALAEAGAGPQDAVMIGDNTATDGAAAEAAGVTFHLIGHAPHPVIPAEAAE